MATPDQPRTAVDVRSLFDIAARDYDRTRRQYVPHFDDFYGAAIDLIPGDRSAPLRILDLGAGTGLLAALIATAFPNAHLTLADFAPEMLDRARRRFVGRAQAVDYARLDYIQGDIPGQYDVIASALSLHHTPHDQLREVFRKIHGALKPGGRFINADQALGASAANEAAYGEAWLRDVRVAGCAQADIDVALERIKADKTALMTDQLDWMAGAGFVNVDCWFKYYRFAVYSGDKPAG